MFMARKKHGTSFSINTYWHENKSRVLIGLMMSVIAVGIVYITTAAEEMDGILFREIIFAAAAWPSSLVQSTMQKNEKRISQ